MVLSAVKVLMKFLELLPKDSDYYNTLLKKLSPPLVTLLSGEPEVQYVALRNINLIVQKRCVFTNRRGVFSPSHPTTFQHQPIRVLGTSESLSKDVELIFIQRLCCSFSLRWTLGVFPPLNLCCVGCAQA